jgi:hypothetical protein
MVGDVQDDQRTDVFREFSDAVLAFADDTGPANLESYLAASRAIEESRGSRREKGQEQSAQGRISSRTR